MPELPDVTVYIESLERMAGGRVLEDLRVASPFLVRSVEPPPSAAIGRRVEGFERIGKRIVFAMEGDLFLVIHLMISGRLRWKKRGTKPPAKTGLATFDFDQGTVLFTEASPKKRASLHVVAGREGLAEHDRGGIEVLDSSLDAFAEALRRENHTVKRSLTDPRFFSGIGNAYSDEILHRAQLSPALQTSRLDDERIERLHRATQAVLTEWIERLRAEVGDGFPDKVTAFRPEMAVHGKYREPCPVCGAMVQRIVYSANESNYCARCQTGGKLLSDRALSRLLKKDWPKTLEELEQKMEGRKAP